MHNIEISKEHQACLNAHWDIQWKTFVLMFFCLKKANEAFYLANQKFAFT